MAHDYPGDGHEEAYRQTAQEQMVRRMLDERDAANARWAFTRRELELLRGWGEALNGCVSDWAAENLQLLARLQAMTTDPEEGRRQIEAMQPPKLQVGDKVRLSAGGERVMTVVGLVDYENMAVCDWEVPDAVLIEDKDRRDTFPVRSLVRVDDVQK